MDVLQWSDNFSVGHPEIDQQHKQLFSLFSTLSRGIEEGGPSFHMDQAFIQLCGYVKNHFRFEERLMKKANFPELAAHKKKHTKIKNKLQDFRKEFNKTSGKKKDAIALDVAKFLQEWLQSHINGEDQKYSPYISKPQAPETTAIQQGFAPSGKFTSQFIWSDKYSVGNQKIDEQHQRLFAIFDGLVRAINRGDSVFGAEKTFLQLRGYVKNHFRYEESLMKKNRYPGYKEHKKKHNAICDALKSYRERFNDEKQDKETIAVEVAQFFESWLKGHIKAEDQQYTPYVGN
jgi:hemerythrin